MLPTSRSSHLQLAGAQLSWVRGVAGRFAVYDLAAADNDDGEGGSLTIHQAAEKGLHKELVRWEAAKGQPACRSCAHCSSPPPKSSLSLLSAPSLHISTTPPSQNGGEGARRGPGGAGQRGPHSPDVGC